jgi:hypothetical protein
LAPRSPALSMSATFIGKPELRVRFSSLVSASLRRGAVSGAYGKKTSCASRTSLAGSPSARATAGEASSAQLVARLAVGHLQRQPEVDELARADPAVLAVAGPGDPRHALVDLEALAVLTG